MYMYIFIYFCVIYWANLNIFWIELVVIMLNFCFTYQMFAFVLCENKLLNWIKWLKLQMNYERWLLWQYVAGFVLNSVSVVNPIILTPLPYIANYVDFR